MRRVHASSTGPRFLLSKDGFFKELSTGTDDFAEQNRPEYHLQSWLCTFGGWLGGNFSETDIFESFRIVHGNLVQFEYLPDNADGEPEAVIGFVKPKKELYGETPESEAVTAPQFMRALEFGGQDITAALAMGNFAIRVKGVELTRALAQFHEAIQAGNVVMAKGSRLDGSKTGWEHGLTLVNMALLTDDEKQQLIPDVVKSLRQHQLCPR